MDLWLTISPDISWYLTDISLKHPLQTGTCAGDLPLGELPVLLPADPELLGISRLLASGFEPGLFPITGGIILVVVAVFFVWVRQYYRSM
jgi:hypothetical protein